MSQLLQRLIDQLDTLVPFLALRHEDVFSLLAEHYSDWVYDGVEVHRPDTLELYQTQVAHSAFLLGYSYFEAYLADLATAIYRQHPEMLPGEKKLDFGEVVAAKGYDAVLSLMIEKEVRAVFYGSMEEIGRYFGRKFSIDWPEDPEIVRASLIRNCLLHNSSRADGKLAAVSDYELDDVIVLKAHHVHDFGISGRRIARQLDAEAEQRHLNREPSDSNVSD